MSDLPPRLPETPPCRRWWEGHRRYWLLSLTLLALVSAGLVIQRLLAASHPRPPLRVMVVRAAADPGSGLSEAEAQTLSNLFEDVLEGFGNCSVSKAETLPDADMWKDPVPEGLVIRLHPRKVGVLLALDSELASPDRIQRRQPLLWRTMTPTSPLEAYRSLIEGLPAEVLDARFEALIPEKPEAFWHLFKALGSGPTQQAFAAAKAARQQAPDCAGPDFVLGHLHYLRANNSTAKPEDLEQAQQHFQEAMKVTINYPSGVYDLARLKSDTGSAEAALKLTLKARSSRPNGRALLGALAYCARYSGMLDLAARANARANALDINPKAPPRLQLALFYQGNLADFERSLYLRPGSYSNNLVQFYMGRLALHRGETERAIAHLEEGENGFGGSQKVTRLCRSFRLILQGQSSMARIDLERVRAELNAALIPDGEMTLSVAEAYLLIGEPDSAMDLVEQSVQQGFQCTPWFEQNPVLAPLRDSPRWQKLHRFLLDQQARMYSNHPEAGWGL